MKQLAVILLLMFCMNCLAQHEKPFTMSKVEQLRTAYTNLQNQNDSVRQEAYFNAFPNGWYQYNSMMHMVDDAEIRKYCDAMESLTTINDTVFCIRLLSLGIGADFDIDAGSHLQQLIRHKMGWITDRSKINDMEKHNRMASIMFWVQEQALPGDVFRFWEIYWSGFFFEEHGLGFDYSQDPEFLRLKSISEHKHPSLCKAMSIAFEYFYHKVWPISFYPDDCISVRVKSTRPLRLEPETVIRELKWFYKACMTDGIDMNNLYNKYLTKSMREKMHRLMQVTNSDILLRAQDFSDYGRENVSVRHLDWHWYEVSYQFSPTSKPERIPIRIDDALEDVRILYVVPEWGDTAYGDSLLITDNVRIEAEDADKFIRTFYQKYTNLYIEMPETLQEDLQLLRQRYCTDKFLKFYNSIKTELTMEYAQDAYDAVIDNYDFDAFWRSSLKIENIAPLRYKVSHAPSTAFTVTLKQVDGTYKIDSINTRMEEVLKEARHP